MKRWLRGLAVALVGTIIGLLLLGTLYYAYKSSKTNGQILSSGELRKYLLYVPKTRDPSSAAPLVISLHGAFLWPGSQARFSMWNDLSDKEGFVVVYPKASGFPGLWRLKPGSELATEVQFFSDLIDSLAADLNIDRTRVYVNGFSNGAAMTIMLSCTMADRIAAFGMVATPTVPWDWCLDQRPASVIAFHGTRDPFVPYEGGENLLTRGLPLAGMKEWFSRWGKRSLCTSGPIDIELKTDIRIRRFSDCAEGTAAVLYTIEGAGHIWPGGMRFAYDLTGPYSDSINATTEMWQFFKDHALSTAAIK